MESYVRFFKSAWKCDVNPLNAELNPIFHLLALLGAHHILHVGRIGVKTTWILGNYERSVIGFSVEFNV